MYGYNLIKKKTIGFIMLSNHDDNSQFVGKIEDYDLNSFNNNLNFSINKGITEFYYFKTTILNINNIYLFYFDKNNFKYRSNLDLINNFYNNYKNIVLEETYLIYGLDILNSDFTYYLKFTKLEDLYIFTKNISNKFYLSLIDLENIFSSYSNYLSHFYFKTKFKSDGNIYYSLVFDFNDFSSNLSLDNFLSLLNITDENIINTLYNLYSENKFVEISYNLDNMKYENIYFFEKF